MLGTLLGVSLLAVLVVDVADAETGLVTLSPLKVVHERPGKVPADVDAIKSRGGGHGLDVVVVVAVAHLVLEDLLEGQVVLVLDAGAALGDVDLGVAVALAQPDEQVAEARGAGAQPGALRLLADAVAAVVPEGGLEVAVEVVELGLRVLVLDVVGRVVVHAVEVVGALDQGNLLGREGGQAVAELLAHRGRVVAQVDGVGEPGDGELDLAVGSLDVPGIPGVVGVGGIAVEDNGNLTAVGGLKVITVGLDSTAVGEEEVVADDPGLGGAVTHGALLPVGGAARGELANAVAEDGRAPGLVEGDPVLDLGEGLEADAGKVLKVQGELLAVQQAAVALVELVGHVPVGQGDVGDDALGEQVIAELGVVVEAGLVDGVVAAALGDDARPGQGEAVGLGAELLEQGHVLGRAVVRVAGRLARAAVGDLAGDLGEGIPDTRAATILFDGSLDLVTVARVSVSMYE